MKINLKYYIITIFLAFVFLLYQLKLIAQASGASHTTTADAWYMQPWAWITGGVILLIILIAIFSGGKKRSTPISRTDKVTITKTIRTETDVDD